MGVSWLLSLIDGGIPLRELGTKPKVSSPWMLPRASHSATMRKVVGENNRDNIWKAEPQRLASKWHLHSTLDMFSHETPNPEG